MDWKTGRPLKEVIAENNAKAAGNSVGASPFDNPGPGASPFDKPGPGAGGSPFDNVPVKTTDMISPFDAPDQIGKPPSQE